MPIALCAVATSQTDMRSHLFGLTTIIKHQDNKHSTFQAGHATHGYSASRARIYTMKLIELQCL